MMYMVEKFKTPDYWYPADLHKRARVNEYLSWQHMSIRMHGSKMFWVKVSNIRDLLMFCIMYWQWPEFMTQANTIKVSF